jgi:hypothetical protein
MGWFVLQVLSARYDVHNEGGVAWYAHIGGFTLGLATALLIKGELRWDLVRDRHGTLVFRERGLDPLAGKVLVSGVAYDYAENDVAGDGIGLPDACPHCGESLDERMRITPGVARCGNESCARLVYAGMQFA